MVDGRRLENHQIAVGYLRKGLTDGHHATFRLLLMKHQILYNKTGISISGKSHRFKKNSRYQKFCPQYLSTESSFYIYDRALTDTDH